MFASFGAYAQNAGSQSDTVNVNAEIYQPLAINCGESINLPAVIQGQSKTIAATDAGAAECSITGEAGQEVVISAPSSVLLTHEDPGVLSDMNVLLSYTEALSLHVLPDPTQSGEGLFIFGIGAELSAAESAIGTPGKFAGSFDVDVSYSEYAVD